MNFAFKIFLNKFFFMKGGCVWVCAPKSTHLKTTTFNEHRVKLSTMPPGGKKRERENPVDSILKHIANKTQELTKEALKAASDFQITKSKVENAPPKTMDDVSDLTDTITTEFDRFDDIKLRVTSVCNIIDRYRDVTDVLATDQFEHIAVRLVATDRVIAVNIELFEGLLDEHMSQEKWVADFNASQIDLIKKIHNAKECSGGNEPTKALTSLDITKSSAAKSRLIETSSQRTVSNIFFTLDQGYRDVLCLLENKIPDFLSRGEKHFVPTTKAARFTEWAAPQQPPTTAGGGVSGD